MSKTAEQVIREYGAMWERMDVEAIADAMTEDCVYVNVPLPPMKGREAVRTWLKSLAWDKATAADYTFLNLVTAPDGVTVLAERDDAFYFGKDRATIPVMATYVVRGDKIAELRDYFDFGAYLKQMSEIGQKAQLDE